MLDIDDKVLTNRFPLMGLAKYMLKQFMPQMTNRMKEEVLARVTHFPILVYVQKCLAMCVVTIIPLWDGT